MITPRFILSTSLLASLFLTSASPALAAESLLLERAESPDNGSEASQPAFSYSSTSPRAEVELATKGCHFTGSGALLVTEGVSRAVKLKSSLSECHLIMTPQCDEDADAMAVKVRASHSISIDASLVSVAQTAIYGWIESLGEVSAFSLKVSTEPATGNSYVTTVDAADDELDLQYKSVMAANNAYTLYWGSTETTAQLWGGAPHKTGVSLFKETVETVTIPCDSWRSLASEGMVGAQIGGAGLSGGLEKSTMSLSVISTLLPEGKVDVLDADGNVLRSFALPKPLIFEAVPLDEFKSW